MCYSQIWQNFGGDEYLCKLGKEYLNASLCKCVVYSLQHSETFDVSHVFLPLTIAELSTLKQVRFFCPPCTIVWTSVYLCLACAAASSGEVCIIHQAEKTELVISWWRWQQWWSRWWLWATSSSKSHNRFQS